MVCMKSIKQQLGFGVSPLLILAPGSGLRARVWYEHVPSEDNPADVLSRDALDDAAVRAKVSNGEWIWREAVVPDFLSPVDYSHLWGSVWSTGA